VAAPSDTLGPFPPRGLSDHPEKADNGSAMLAENVEFLHGDLRPRRGTVVCGQTFATHDGWKSSSFDLIHEFSKSGGERAVLMVCVPSTGPRAGGYEVSLWSPGSMSGHIEDSGGGEPLGAHIPNICEFAGRVFLFLPNVSGNIVLDVDVGGIEAWRYMAAGRPLPAPIGGDEGVYYNYGTDEPEHMPTFACEYNNRMYMAGFDGDWCNKIKCTSIGDPYGWCKQNEIVSVGTDPVTGLASFAGSLVIFKRGQITLAKSYGQGAEVPEPLTRHTGCLAHHTICQFSNRLGFMAEGGYMVMDQTGNIQEFTAGIHESFMECAADLKNARVVHYAAKHQLWILFPSFGRIYVADLKTNSWSTIRLGHDSKIGCLGLTRYLTGDVPVAGIVNPSGESYVVRFEYNVQKDYYDTPSGSGFVTARWMSTPLPVMGRHQVRIFRVIRLVMADFPAQSGSEDPYLIWATEGQALGAVYFRVDSTQRARLLPVNASVPLDSCEPPPRIGDAVDEAGDAALPPAPAAPIPGADAYVAWGVGEQFVPVKVSPGGRTKGRWIQIGIESVGGDFALRSFELDTRREQGRR
jgi:hypothetical protein